MTPFLPKMLQQSLALTRFNGYEIHQELAKVFRSDCREVWKRPEDVYRLRAVLFFVRRLQAPVISDKLFSLYTILRAFFPEFPEPQQDITPAELWPTATVVIIKSMRCLDLIINVHHVAKGELPSWSFDWTSKERVHTYWDAADDVLQQLPPPPGTAWHHALAFEPEIGPYSLKGLRIKGVRHSTITHRSACQTGFREWYVNNQIGQDTEREKKVKFTSLMEETEEILREWTLPTSKQLCRELVIWDQIPDQLHYKFFEEWYPTMTELKYLYEHEVLERAEKIADAQSRLIQIGRSQRFHAQLCVNRLWRCFFRTEDERVGDGFHTVQEGDLVVLLCWSKVPAILRPTKDDPSLYNLVSFAYIEGLVGCHTWNMQEEELEEFTLV